MRGPTSLKLAVAASAALALAAACCAPPGATGSSGGTAGASGTGGGGSGSAGNSGGSTGAGNGSAGSTGGAASSSGSGSGGTGCGAAVDGGPGGCFSHGVWSLANLSPCVYTLTEADGGSASGLISTIPQGGQFACPMAFGAAPTEDWSSDSLTTDCGGTYTLCYTLKAGDAKSPLPTDCTIVKVCTAAAHASANSSTPFPDLPGWLADASASGCIAQFEASGGYGLMSVSGTSDACGSIAKDLAYVTYCPTACNGPNAPPSCTSCTPGGGGTF